MILRWLLKVKLCEQPDRLVESENLFQGADDFVIQPFKSFVSINFS